MKVLRGFFRDIMRALVGWEKEVVSMFVLYVF
jgi:hypothetical protein